MWGKTGKAIRLKLAVLLGLTLLSTQIMAEAAAIKNIVLVHGAFTDGSSWKAVITQLQHKGYHVTAVQNPLTSLQDDVNATEHVIARQQGPVLLVGHSWGGVVVADAANDPKVKGMVFLSALVPNSGESAADLLQRLHAPMTGMLADSHGLIWLDSADHFAEIMAGDVPEALVRELTAVQQPIAARAFDDKVKRAAWKSKPSWYLLTTDDKALPPAVQTRIAASIGASIERIASSHMSLVSHPEQVAALIDRAARTLTTP
ncbi:alpha/beta fold hydrolase [Pantoea ananatis]|uniref:alpha/beta fold hydrolase n=1 Tax=Pantoea ananas TaxID=553 RepID=UPI00049100C0|nr:alpha/beta hydrolase [Pantoea ananatis]